jgi:hypothetical protein
MRAAVTGAIGVAWIRAADTAGDVARSLPAVDPNRVHRYVEHGKVAGLGIKE